MVKGGAYVAKGTMHGEGGCGKGGHVLPGGCEWQERRPLQWVVRILLECILVIWWVSVILCKTECYTSVIFSIFIFILLLCTSHLYWIMGHIGMVHRCNTQN